MIEELVDERLVSVGEAAAFLSCSRSQIYVLFERGELPWFKIGKMRRIAASDLVKLKAKSSGARD
jgi:excisionase family DNA binding protein